MKTLGILLFPKFQLLDVFGPVDVFGSITDKIKIVFIAQNKGLVKSSQGTQVQVDYDFTDAPNVEVLLIPGGIGTRNEVFNSELLDWIKVRAEVAELVLSVCTGSVLLAKSGVLDNHCATSNKLALKWAMEQGPNVHWIKKARWVDDNKIITSSGITAGIDMSLYVVAKLYGQDTRDEIARWLEYDFNPDADNDKFAIDYN